MKKNKTNLFHITDGQVYAFDIQESAIENTRKKISEKAYTNRVQLIKDGHEKLDLYVQNSVACAMFNLGYLPKGDKNIVTKGNTTIIALEKCLELLKVEGLITVCIYTAHSGGLEESQLVEKYLRQLDKMNYQVLKYSSLNDESSPYILLVKRVK